MHLNPKGKNYNLNLNKYNQKTKTCGYRTINCAIKNRKRWGNRKQNYMKKKNRYNIKKELERT